MAIDEGTYEEKPGSSDVERFYALRNTANDCFEVETFHIVQGIIRIGYRVALLNQTDIKKKFNELGYRAYLYNGGSRKFCSLMVKNPETTRTVKKEMLKAWVLFILTLISTTVVGYYHALEAHEAGVVGNVVPGALGFSFTILLILGAHELAHKWAASRNGIDASPPFFLPFPSLIGTLGAVIRVKSPMPDANASLMLGVSGPIAGFVFTIPALIVGVILSKPVLISSLVQGDTQTVLGSTLLLQAVYVVFGAEVQPGYALQIHPIAIAAWAGLLVTSLNLLPIGQLDGGHILHALLGEKIHEWVSLVLICVMFAVGAPGMLAMFGLMGPLNNFAYDNFWPGWFIWSLLGYFIIKRKYPTYINRKESLNRTSWMLGIIALVIFILCFMPVPIKVYEIVGTSI